MRAVLSSFNSLRSWKTILATFVIIPTLSIAMIMFVFYTYTGTWNNSVLRTSIIVSGAIRSMSSMSGSLVYDKLYGVSDIILARHRKSAYYWSSKMFCVLIITFTSNLIYLIIASLINIDFSDIWKFLLVGVFFSIGGISIGAISVFLFWNRRNPYFLINIIATFCYVFSCVVVPINSYPIAMRIFVYLLPFGNTISSMSGSGQLNFLYDIFLVIAYYSLFGILILFTSRRKR